MSDASSSAIDAGAGTGRFALALAGGVRHVTAVDPSEAMLAVLTRGADELGATNVTTLHSRWEDAGAGPADVVFSSFVLALVPDAVPFLEKLEAVARRRVLLYLGSFSADALLDPLWRHFHEAPRAPGASYLDALAVLREMGIEPRVKVVEIPNRKRFATVDDAVEHYRDALHAPDTPEARARGAAAGVADGTARGAALAAARHAGGDRRVDAALARLTPVRKRGCGRSRIAAALLGGSAEGVLRHAGRPVLLVPPPGGRFEPA